jgi:hypothetical protein
MRTSPLALKHLMSGTSVLKRQYRTNVGPTSKRSAASEPTSYQTTAKIDSNMWNVRSTP